MWLFGVSLAVAQTPGWLSVAASEGGQHIYEAKQGSYEVTRTQGGDEIAVVIGRHEDKSTSTVHLQKWYVKTMDCRAKQGKIVTLKMDGSFSFEGDYVDGGGNIASAKGEFICAVYDFHTAQRRKKSL